MATYPLEKILPLLAAAACIRRVDQPPARTLVKRDRDKFLIIDPDDQNWRTTFKKSRNQTVEWTAAKLLLYSEEDEGPVLLNVFTKPDEAPNVELTNPPVPEG